MRLPYDDDDDMQMLAEDAYLAEIGKPPRAGRLNYRGDKLPDETLRRKAQIRTEVIERWRRVEWNHIQLHHSVNESGMWDVTCPMFGNCWRRFSTGTYNAIARAGG